jgi:dipeptidyl aminopeptidase/acylaminoacyl peptidase
MIKRNDGASTSATKLLLSMIALLAAVPCGIARSSDEEADSRRPPAITAADVPVVPADIWNTLSRYQNTREAEFQGWAPDGNGILIRTRFGNSSQLHRVYEPEGRREQITFFDEPVSGRFIPGETDDGILASLSTGGDENYQVYLLDRINHKTTRLTDGTSRNTLGPITRDGEQVIIASNRRNGRDTDLYVADPRQPDSMEMVFETDGQFWRAADWAPDGRTLLITRYVSINESYYALLDVQTRKRTDLQLPRVDPKVTLGDARIAIGSLAFSADGNSVYLTTDAASEFQRLAMFDLQTQQYRWLADGIRWDVSDVEVDPTSGSIAFAVNEDGASRLYLIQNDQRRELKLPLGIVSDLKFSPDGTSLGLTLSRPDAPSDAYSLRLSDGMLTRWTISEVGGLDPSQFVTPSRIQYPTFDGRSIPAYYFRPQYATAETPAPVLINIHGGPESQYRPYFSSATQHYVNELGLAVIYPNVRGSSGYGKSYVKLDNAQLREDSVRDIGALLDWIEQQPELDASRVAVAGGSYGGYMVLASLVHYGERIRAGINVVGIANFITFLENTAAYRQDLRRAEYGDERDPEMRAFFEKINPTSNADRIQSALMVAHGVNDPRVPFSEAKQIADKVRANGRSVWTVYADNEGHGFAKKDNSDYVRAVQTLFLQQHLIDAAATDPSGAAELETPTAIRSPTAAGP